MACSGEALDVISFQRSEGSFAESVHTQSDWEDSFLNWFSSLNIPMAETKLKLGGLAYYHFSTLIKNDPSKKIISGFGSHQNRKIAAIKCAAETIERLEMLKYFSKNMIIPRELQTSNGWAVHSSLKLAQDKALAEATERHLLLKAYFRHGWGGFKLIQKIEAGDVTLYLNLGNYTQSDQVSILVAAQSKKFSGVSFGYGLGQMDQLNSSEFWTSAIFEACDRILMSASVITPAPADNWIRQELHYFLNTPFDFSVFKENSDSNFFEQEKDLSSVELITQDLAKKNNLDFPLYSAFAKSDDLIPLFTKRNLKPVALDYLDPILKGHQIFKIPDRHPIL